MNEIVRSVHGVPIRLSDERWVHIVEHHDDMAGYYHDVLETVRTPDRVYEGDGERVACHHGAIHSSIFGGGLPRALPSGRICDYGILHDSHQTDREEAVGVEKGVVLELLASLPHLLKLPSKQIWFDFDEEADVLYVSFERPQGATDSELSEDGILMRYRGDQLVGVTILNVRKRIASAT